MSAIRTGTVVCSPAGINHCQDASNPLKIPFSWVSRDHKLQVIVEQDVPDKELRRLLSFPKTSPAAAPEEAMKAEASSR